VFESVVIRWSLEVPAEWRQSVAVQNRGVETAVAGLDPGVDGAPQSLEGLVRLAWTRPTWALGMSMPGSRHSSAKMLYMLAMHPHERVSCQHKQGIANMLETAYMRKELLCRFLLLQ